MVGEALVGPVVLVPAAADDPLARLGLRGAAAHQFGDLLLALGADEIELELAAADGLQVAVALDEARHHELAFEIDDARLRPGQALDCPIVA